MPFLFLQILLTVDMVIRFIKGDCSVDINSNSEGEPFNDFINII